MKKYFKFLMVMLSVFSIVALSTTVNAEELEEGDAVTEEVQIEDMLQDFLDKWLQPILSAIAGALGSFLTVLLSKFVVNRLEKKVNDMTNATEQEKKEAVDEYNKAVKVLENAKAVMEEEASLLLDTFKKVYEENEKLIQENEKLLSKFETLQNEVEEFKTLVAYLVSTTPTLASNGYASKILTLLNEDGVKDEKEKV